MNWYEAHKGTIVAIVVLVIILLSIAVDIFSDNSDPFDESRSGGWYSEY